MNVSELDALSLEYKRDYGTASREIDILDFVNNPFVNCVVRVLGSGLPEEVGDLPSGEIGIPRDNVADSFLIT